MQNTLGKYILILTAVLITLTRMVLMTGPKLVSHYSPFVLRLMQYVHERMLSASMQPPPPLLEVYEHHTAIICIFYNTCTNNVN